MKLNTNLWSALETGTNAIPSIWRERVGSQFDTVRGAFLNTRPEPAQYFQCRKCGCAHRVAIHAPDNIVAVCTCDPWNCDELMLSAADIEVMELNWAKLARALCQAFGLDAKSAKFGLRHTRQIGSWSADAVPVILTIQRDHREFQYTVAVLAARLRRKFILLAPTSIHFDATSQELLASVGAECFPLDAHLTLTHHGTLQSRTTPGELFANFAPQPKEAEDENDACRAFAIIDKLDRQSRRKAPSVLTVYRLYCREALTARESAKRCRCSVGTVLERLRAINVATGLSPAALRSLSPHIERVRDSLTDPRARKSNAKSAIYDEGDGF